MLQNSSPNPLRREYLANDSASSCRQDDHIPLCALVKRAELDMSNGAENPDGERPKWRGRTEVLLLVAGGLILLIPTIAIFLAGAG